MLLNNIKFSISVWCSAYAQTFAWNYLRFISHSPARILSMILKLYLQGPSDDQILHSSQLLLWYWTWMSWKYEAWKNGNFVVLDIWLKEIHIFSWLLHRKAYHCGRKNKVCEKGDERKKTEQVVNMGGIERDSDRKRKNFTSDWKISPNVYIKPQKYYFSDNASKYLLQQLQNRYFFQVLKDISKNRFSFWSSLLYIIINKENVSSNKGLIKIRFKLD